MTGTYKLPLVAMALLSIGAPALSAPSHSTASITVDYTGIDISTPDGARTLERRVESAIRKMCGAQILGTRDEADALRLCRSEAQAAVAPALKTLIADAGVKFASSR